MLHDKGKVTAAIAKAFAESEVEQYRVLQDRLYQSDFDRLVAAGQEAEEQKSGKPPVKPANQHTLIGRFTCRPIFLFCRPKTAF